MGGVKGTKVLAVRVVKLSLVTGRCGDEG